MSTLDPARLVDGALEASVVGSFTRIGYQVRRRLSGWAPLSSMRLEGKIAIVTGATSGLGRTTAESLARLGAAVMIVGRDADRTESARREISAAAGAAEVESDLADLSLLSETAAFAERFVHSHRRLDILVLNAGVLSHDYTLTSEGNETTLATHVLSQFLLLERLRPLLTSSAPSRVIVVASGGMDTEPLDVDALAAGPAAYEGMKLYARCKRAQVVLAEEWARRLDDGGVTVNAMHPGWADTPGLRTALPSFSRLLGPLLRTPEEGADTIVCLRRRRRPRARAASSSSTGAHAPNTVCSALDGKTRAARRHGSGASASSEPRHSPAEPARSRQPLGRSFCGTRLVAAGRGNYPSRVPRGYMEGPASEEAERRADEAARGKADDPKIETELAVYGSTADDPEPHFLGWRSELDSDDLFHSGKAWGLTLRRIARSGTAPAA